MKKTRVLSIATVALLVLGMVLTGCQGTGANSSSTTGPIKIGAIMPMTGDVSVYGVSTSNAIKIVIDEINKAGGINGRQVELVLQDDQNLPDKSVDCFKKLTSQDKVDVIIGSVASKCTLAVAPEAQKAGIPLITTASTNDAVTKIGDYIFRTCYTDPFQGTVCGKFATESLKKTKAAILYDNGNDYSKGLATEFEKAFTAGGGTITDKEAYTKDDTDFSAIISKVKATNPEIIFLPDYYNKDALITKQVREAGMADVIMLGGDGWDGITGVAGLECVGTYFSNHYDPSAKDPDVVAFVDKYKKAYNDVPNALAALGYDAMEIVAKAITAAGSTDKAKVRDAMAKVTGKFVTGNISFDANRNPVKSVVMVTLVKGDDGKLAAEYYSTVNP